MIGSSKILHKLLKSCFTIGSIHIFVAVMKLIFFSIGILLAIFHPTSYSFAGNNIPAHNFDLVQQEQLPIQDLFDIADDDTNDSERKNLLISKAAYKADSFINSGFSNSFFKSIWASRYFFKLHPSLFIFLGTLRL